jgi:hypothetical protein
VILIGDQAVVRVQTPSILDIRVGAATRVRAPTAR